MTEIPEILRSRFSLSQSLLIVDMLHLGAQVGTVRLLCSQHKYEEGKKKKKTLRHSASIPLIPARNAAGNQRWGLCTGVYVLYVCSCVGVRACEVVLGEKKKKKGQDKYILTSLYFNGDYCNYPTMQPSKHLPCALSKMSLES